MSRYSDRSAWTSTPSRAPGGQTRVRECRLPKHWSVNALVWATGRQPSKVKSVRQYRTTWPDDASDTGSNSSFWSNYSWGSQGSYDEICFVESTRNSYYYDDGWEDGRQRKTKKKRGSPKKSKRKHHPSSSSSEDDSDSDSSDTSLSDYGGVPGPRTVPPFHSPAGMPGMPGMNRGPPMGGPFGRYGGPPQPGGPIPRPMSGFGGPQPPYHGPPGGMPMPPPPQPGFAQGRGGIQVVGVDP